MDLFSYDKVRFKLSHEPIRLFESFSGIGTQAMALERLGVKIEHIGISEIDKYALMSYNAIHGNVKNYGDICKINGKDLPQIDIFTWSFPCTDLSKAGKQKGLSGTRSGLGYEVIRIISDMVDKPKMLLMENVSDLLSKKFKDGWREIYHEIEKLGYTNYVEILNAKDYGVAQNRERVFMVSILGDYAYTFPKPFELKKRLKDYLEDEVDEKYYLSEQYIKTFTKDNTGKYPRAKRFINSLHKDTNKIAHTITTRSGERPTDNFILIPEATKQGYALAEDGDGVYINRPHQKRGVVQKGMIQTIKTSSDDIEVVVRDEHQNVMDAYNKFIDEKGYIPEFFNPYNNSEIKDISPTITTMCDRWQSSSTISITNNLRIRKLTPLECWRLMGIKDEYFWRAKNAGVSDSQLYKQAGNAIVVDVLVEIFKRFLGDE